MKFSYIIIIFILTSLNFISIISLADTSTKNQSTYKRPRLYLSTEKINIIKKNLHQEPYNRIWMSILNTAEKDLQSSPKLINTPEKLEITTPDRIHRLAATYIFTGDKKYLDHALLWIDTLIALDNWGDNKDLVASHGLFALALAYDWLHDELGPIRSVLIKNKINKHASLLYQLLIDKKVWWAADYLQGHNYYNVMSIAVAGVTMYDEIPEAVNWVTVANKNMTNVADLLSPDGASHEGIGYWASGVEALLCQYFATRYIAQEDSLIESKFLRNAATFRLYMSLPGFRENVNFADSHNYEWTGPGNILRALASLYKDPYAQWLAQSVEQARTKGVQTWLASAKYSWLDLVWFDPEVSMKPPDSLPNYYMFDNLGLFVFRTDWTPLATWFMYKAAPPQGWHAYNKNVITFSHIHPDEGQVLLYSQGKWLLRDEGYAYLKLANNHNVIIVNQKGQLGEGDKWFRGGTELGRTTRRASATVLKKDFSDTYQYLVTDNSNLYSQYSGLKSWQRHIISLKGDTFLVADDIELENLGNIKTLFHLDPTAKLSVDNQICLDGENEQFVIKQIFPNYTPYDLTDYSIEKKIQHDSDHGIYRGKLLTIKDENKYSVLNIYIIKNQSCNEVITKNIEWKPDKKKFITKSGDLQYSIDIKNMTITSSPSINFINKANNVRSN